MQNIQEKDNIDFNIKNKSEENFEFLKAIPIDLEFDHDFGEDKLIFEDEFRDVLIQKNLKILRPYQAELFTIVGNKEIKETLNELKEREMVDELLGIVSIDESQLQEENQKNEIDAEEKIKNNLIGNFNI